MSELSTKIKSFLKNRKINVFLLFFALAFFILILARLSADYTKTVKFNVELNNVPEEMIVLNNKSRALDLTLTANGFNWLNYYIKTPTVTINYNKDVKKLDSLYIWSLSRGYAGINAQFDKEIIVKSINPDTLLFKVDFNDVKTIPVKQNIKFSFSPGYNVQKDIITEPDSIKIIGPKTLLNKINFVETEFIEKTEINKPFNLLLALKLDELSPKINVKTRRVSVNVNTKKFTEGTINLPITIVNVPDNIKVNYFPKTINVSYYVSLEKYNAIKASDFKLVCDFNERNSNSAYLIPKLVNTPKTLKSMRLHQQKIEYIISE